MTDDDARRWIVDRFGVGAFGKLEQFASLVVDEATRQNLIAPSTIDTIWVRHIVDSAQLVPFALPLGVWLDVGTGAGFPGMVAAILRPEPTVLVEPRTQRAVFLSHCVSLLGLEQVEVHPTKVDNLAIPAAVISARAVAPIEKLLHAAQGCSTPKTRWLLPRGRSGGAELAALRQRWSGMFHMKQSLTELSSSILIAEQVRPR